MKIEMISDEKLENVSGGLAIITGLNSGNPKRHEAPDAAINGASVAFPKVLANTGGLDNVDIDFS